MRPDCNEPAVRPTRARGTDRHGAGRAQQGHEAGEGARGGGWRADGRPSNLEGRSTSPPPPPPPFLPSPAQSTPGFHALSVPPRPHKLCAGQQSGGGAGRRHPCAALHGRGPPAQRTGGGARRGTVGRARGAPGKTLCGGNEPWRPHPPLAPGGEHRASCARGGQQFSVFPRGGGRAPIAGPPKNMVIATGGEARQHPTGGRLRSRAAAAPPHWPQLRSPSTRPLQGHGGGVYVVRGTGRPP